MNVFIFILVFVLILSARFLVEIVGGFIWFIVSSLFEYGLYSFSIWWNNRDKIKKENEQMRKGSVL